MFTIKHNRKYHLPDVRHTNLHAQEEEAEEKEEDHGCCTSCIYCSIPDGAGQSARAAAAVGGDVAHAGRQAHVASVHH